MQKFFLFPLLLVACPAIHAQTTFILGPQVGLNVTTATYHQNDAPLYYDTSIASLTRFEAGLLATIGYGHFLLQPALLYSQKGFVLNGTLLPTPFPSSRPITAQLTSELNYLTLPLNFVYAQKATGEGFRVFGGGYVALLVSGKRKVHDEYTGNSTFASFYDSELPIKPGSNSESTTDFYAKRLDAGLQAGVGYQYQSALVQVTYSMGLTSPSVPYAGQAPAQTPSYYNRSLAISLTCLLHPTEATNR